MPKSATPKWAVAATWKRYMLAFKKDEAEQILKDWKAAREAEGYVVGGSLSTGYRATTDPATYSDDVRRVQNGQEPLANASARVIKLADHPVCYIGVVEHDVSRLREMEEAENPDFERLSAAAKAKSADWRSVEAL